tara:strand:- start:71 stop:442 length:372 start_codon:yes stop_codon:yes gene_type:complete
MTTANATTNENGYHLSGTIGLKSLTASQMYSDEKSQKPTVWRYKESEFLAKIQYSSDKLTAIGGMRLIKDMKASALGKCHIFESKSPRHVAIHCPEIKQVIIVTTGGAFFIRKDKNFSGRKPS